MDYRPLCAYAESLVVRRAFRRAEDVLRRAIALLEQELAGVLEAVENDERAAEREDRGLGGGLVAEEEQALMDAQEDLDLLLGRAAELRFEFGRLLQRLGTLSAMRQDFVSAEACFERAVDMSPRDPSILHAFGVLMERMQGFERAEQCYLQALTVDHHHVMSLQSYGTYLCDIEGNTAGGRAYLERGIQAGEAQLQHDPHNPAKIAALGSVLRSLGVFLLVVECDVPRAYQLLLRSVDCAPHDATSWVKLATIHHHHGKDYEAAEYAYKQALAADADNHEGLVGLALLLITQGGRKQLAPGSSDAIKKRAPTTADLPVHTIRRFPPSRGVAIVAERSLNGRRFLPI